MIWLALPLTAWAGVAAYGIWAWRNLALTQIREKREEQERTERSFDRIQAMIRQWSQMRPPSPSPAEDFPASGDNFQTLDNIARPHFGFRKPADTQPDGAA